MKITIYTDGSSRGNPGPGGWSAVVMADDEITELGGREDLTTNNRMELMGAIKGLQEVNLHFMIKDDITMDSELLKAKSKKLKAVEICTDSQYVKKGMTEWIEGWIRKGWIGSTKKPVLNKDLWLALKKEEDFLKKEGVIVTWKYVQAHVGIAMNERADTIATQCADNASNLQLYKGPRSGYSSH